MDRTLFKALVTVALGSAGICVAGTSLAGAPAIEGHHHSAAAPSSSPLPAFVATGEKPYGALVDDAMAVMNDGMARAPMHGNADHDFAAMMIPHHQGAVDMAKAELLYGTNPVLRRLAQEIIITQGQEIEVMQRELKKTPAAAPLRH